MSCSSSLLVYIAQQCKADQISCLVHIIQSNYVYLDNQFITIAHLLFDERLLQMSKIYFSIDELTLLSDFNASNETDQQSIIENIQSMISLANNQSDREIIDMLSILLNKISQLSAHELQCVLNSKVNDILSPDNDRIPLSVFTEL